VGEVDGAVDGVVDGSVDGVVVGAAVGGVVTDGSEEEVETEVVTPVSDPVGEGFLARTDWYRISPADKSTAATMRTTTTRRAVSGRLLREREPRFVLF